MLVLSRFPDEEIWVEVPGTKDVIRFMIVSVQGDKVRIGVDAPRNYPVNRKEVAERIQSAKRSFGPIR